MNDPRHTPVQIAVDHGAQELTIAWADGHTSVYSYEGLRRACPCAGCRGGHENMGEPVDPVVWDLPSLQTYEIKTARPVGNYALQLEWGDGHNQGIWSWTFLRSLR